MKNILFLVLALVSLTLQANTDPKIEKVIEEKPITVLGMYPALECGQEPPGVLEASRMSGPFTIVRYRQTQTFFRSVGGIWVMDTCDIVKDYVVTIQNGTYCWTIWNTISNDCN